MIHYSLSYITDMCKQELTPPWTITSLYDLLLFELKYLNLGLQLTTIFNMN